MSEILGDPAAVVRGLRARLQAAGFHPSRFRGQNFLLDENLLRAIVRDAELDSGARVLEVGCGPGSLTAFLLAGGAEVLSVEVDERLAGMASKALAEIPRWSLLVSDVLAGKHELAPALLDRLAEWPAYDLVANLPYAITTPLLLLLGRHERAPEHMTVLVQKEAAERLSASPGSKAYGAATVRLGLRYSAQIVRPVPASVFWPRPKVESAVIRFVRRPDLPAPELERVLDRWIERGFASRRKQLLGQLASLAPREELEEYARCQGWNPAVRAEELTPREWLDLAKALASTDV